MHFRKLHKINRTNHLRRERKAFQRERIIYTKEGLQDTREPNGGQYGRSREGKEYEPSFVDDYFVFIH